MKLYINKRLLIASALFMAWCALTSFNPFSQVHHLAHLETKNITLASNVNVPSAGRSGGARVGTGNQAEGLKKILSQRQNSQNQNSQQDNQQAKTDAQHVQSQTKETGVLDRVLGDKDETAAGACVDCDEDSEENVATENFKSIIAKLENGEELTSQEREALSSKLNGSSEDNEEEAIETTRVICESHAEEYGDYKEYRARISCYEKAKKILGKKSKKKNKSNATEEDYGLMMEEIESLITEIREDTELSSRQTDKLLTKLLKLVRGTDLEENVKAAKTLIEVQKKSEAFAKYLTPQMQRIAGIENQIRQLEGYNNGMNPQLNYQINMLQMQRKQLIYGIEREVTGFQEHVYKRAIPPHSANESEVIADLRAEMSQQYSSFIAPIAPMLDPSLSSLEAQSYSSLAPLTGGSQNSALFNSYVQPSGSGYYDRNNPGAMFSNMDIERLKHLTPAQQVQQLHGLSNNYPGAQPLINQPGQMQGPQQVANQPGQFPRF